MLLGFVSPSFAQNELQYDDETYQQKDFFESDFKEEYLNDSDFDYTEYIEEPSLWQRFKNWATLKWNEFLNWLFADVDGSNFWSVLCFILKNGLNCRINFLNYLIVFAKYNPGQSFLKNSNSSELNWTEEEEIINQKDIPKLIEKAIADAEYRLATRYYFLLILKKLRDKELIDYEYQKTNEAYQKELSKTVLDDHFSEVTRYYDYIWYGDFAVDDSLFVIVKKDFEDLLSQIPKTKKNE